MICQVIHRLPSSPDEPPPLWPPEPAPALGDIQPQPFRAARQQVFALVDCANFYVACQRLFDPALTDRPVVVLSNNDGCVIARSEEAKALGISMGTPAFRHEPLFRRHRVAVFSSNYPLYGDLSRRVVAVLRQCAPEVEIYSIDEAFLSLSGGGLGGAPERLSRWAEGLRRVVWRWTGIPVRVGLGPTKTLAKLANRLAKHTPNGVVNLFDGCGSEGAAGWSQRLGDVLGEVPVGEVWGIGPARRRWLHERGIHSARDLALAPDWLVRKGLSVTGLRTAWELRGLSCLPLEEVPAPKRSLVTSRTFGAATADLSTLRRICSVFTARAAEKARAQGSVVGALTVFLHTDRHDDGPQHGDAQTVTLGQPSAHTPTLIRYAHRCLDRVHAPGYRYRKLGVMLLDLTPAGEGCTLNLLTATTEDDRQRALLRAVDEINRRHGRNTVRWAERNPPVSPDADTWLSRAARLSPAYTTRWDQLATAHL